MPEGGTHRKGTLTVVVDRYSEPSDWHISKMTPLRRQAFKTIASAFSVTHGVIDHAESDGQMRQIVLLINPTMDRCNLSGVA